MVKSAGVRLSAMMVAALVALVMPLAAFAQTPMPPTELLTLVTDASAVIINPTQVTYFVIFASVASIALWLVRRSLKLGR